MSVIDTQRRRSDFPALGMLVRGYFRADWAADKAGTPCLAQAQERLRRAMIRGTAS